MERVKAVILAAGKGSRLQCEKDEIPKALRMVGGKTLIEHVLSGIDFVKPEDITIVIGVMGQKIRDYLGEKYHYAWQKEQHGTAHAMLCAEETASGFDGPVLCLYCDMPLLSRATYARMVEEHLATGAKNTLLAARIHPIPAFGRLIRDENGELCDIVEQSACTEEQKLIDEVNVGIQVMQGDVMWDVLKKVENNNPKKEYYLTGVVKVIHDLGMKNHAVVTADTPEYWGVNTMEELERVEEYLKKNG
ncbi:MAG: UDP-N-acetylglucosamine diphosphorylase [Clostridiales bacterium]|nr:UDP-N-acetylglucosamine diphosphorylase [Clostridiales bacterium]